MEKLKKLLLTAATVQLAIMAIASNAIASNTKNIYQQYLTDLAKCSPQAIAPDTVRHCKNLVAQAVSWANSLEGKQYINSCSNKRAKFIYSVQLAYGGIDSLKP